MVDDRVVMVSSEGYKSLLQSDSGKGLNWTCDIRSELPIKMKPSGPGSERPFTVCQMFMNSVKSGSDRPAMYVEREGKKLCYSWADYGKQAIRFAKSLNYMGVTEKSSVAIMGFNSPEWVFACMGALLNNQVFTGIYITNAPDACLY